MSRRRRGGLIALFVLLTAVIVSVERSPLRHKWQPQRPDAEKYDGKTFTVVKVVDGDTLDIDAPDGKREYTRIRLWGIDTPELAGRSRAAMYFGHEAANFASDLALGNQVVVYLEAQRQTRDRYGRLLAYIKLPDGRFLNEVLLADGFAYADLRFRHGLYNRYKQLEAVARKQKKGLWEKVTRDQLPEWLQRERPALLLDK